MIDDQLRRSPGQPPGQPLGQPSVYPADLEYADRPPPTNGPSPINEPSIGRLFTDLSSDFTDLLREELRLARVETMEKVTTATRSIVSMVAGGLVAYAGLLALLITAILLLGNVVPLWLSSAIVGIAAIVIGFMLISAGRSALSNMTIMPEKTIESIKDDAEWVKEQVQ